MECTESKKKILIYLTEKLTVETGIEFRDTWTGAKNEYFEVQKTPANGLCFFTAEKYPDDRYQSLTYKNQIIILTEQYGGAAYPVVHKAVHLNSNIVN